MITYFLFARAAKVQLSTMNKECGNIGPLSSTIVMEGNNLCHLKIYNAWIQWATKGWKP